MKYLISFTAALLGFIRGKITAEDIQQGIMFFGASASHALTAGVIPFEATWANDKMPRLYGCDVPITLDAVDPDNRGSVSLFLELVRAADLDNRIRWQDGNGLYRVEQLGLRDPEAQVFWSNEWVRAGDLLRDDRHFDSRGIVHFEPPRIEEDDRLPAAMCR